MLCNVNAVVTRIGFRNWDSKTKVDAIEPTNYGIYFGF